MTGVGLALAVGVTLESLPSPLERPRGGPFLRIPGATEELAHAFLLGPRCGLERLVDDGLERGAQSPVASAFFSSRM
jgi:hypothetical protein